MYGKEINYDFVRRKRDDKYPNKWSYFYKYGTKDHFWLMTRELTSEVTDDALVYKLNIAFNGILIKE
jgi:hypothetical protein